MAEGRSFWMCYHSYLDSFGLLDDAALGRLCRACLYYSAHREDDQTDISNTLIGNELFLYKMITPQIDSASSKYLDKADKLRANGAAGGIASGISRRNQALEKAEANASNQSNCFENEANEANSSKRSQGERDGYIKSDIYFNGNGERENTGNRFTPPTPDDVKTYCSEAGLKVDAGHFVDYYAAKGWKIGGESITDWKAAVRNWARRDKTDEQKRLRNYGSENYDQKPIPRIEDLPNQIPVDLS